MPMQLASHNSMSYLTPLRWWLRPFHFIARCQSITIDQQYSQGIRYFDLRIRWNPKNSRWHFAHGLILFDGLTPEAILSRLNELATPSNPIHIRLLLELNRHSPQQSLQTLTFINHATRWIADFSNLRFVELRRKHDWLRLIQPNCPEPAIHQAVSSMTGTILDDWWPWIYARTHNSANRRKPCDADFMMLDFIQL